MRLVVGVSCAQAEMIYGWVIADGTAVVVKVVHSSSGSGEAMMQAMLSKDPSLRVLPLLAFIPSLFPAWRLSAIVTRKCLVLGDWIDSHVRHVVDLVPVVAQLVQVVHTMRQAGECALASQLRR